MIDALGRKIDYIRISVTDRCNLRCVYCMPEEGIPLTSHEELLSYEEILRVCRCAAALGIHKVKLTGGEPLVRREIVELVAGIKAIPGIEKVTLTTNGVLLKKYMKTLDEAGIDAINVSLDTLEPGCFREITRKDNLERVLEGLQEAMKYPHINLKINCVPLGVSGQDLVAIARLAEHTPVHVRFIEMMPIGLGTQFQGVREQEILEELEKHFGKAMPCSESLGNGPGHYFTMDGLTGRIGFISAVSHKFCETCNRVRLTSQGYLKGCLQYNLGCDLRTEMRGGCTDQRLEKLICEAINKKPKGHHFDGDDVEIEYDEKSCMYQIGG